MNFVRAMLLDAPGRPLRLADVPIPVPSPPRPGAGAAARTGLRRLPHEPDVVDGESPPRPLPRVPGHEIVCEVVVRGDGVEDIAEGDRVGVPWLGWTCGACRYRAGGRENVRERARCPGAVCGSIHMSDVRAFPYAFLRGERVAPSGANLARDDGRAFLALAPTVPVRTEGRPYSLEAANRALDDLRGRDASGALPTRRPRASASGRAPSSLPSFSAPGNSRPDPHTRGVVFPILAPHGDA